MASHRQSKGPRILVVEDDRDIRETLSEALRHYGFEVRDTGGYASALETAARFSPQVLVCDWQLGPGTRDGIDVASALQKSLDAKVIFITGRPPSVLRERARSMRIVDIIQKPVSLSRLILAIGRSGKKKCAPVKERSKTAVPWGMTGADDTPPVTGRREP